MTKLKNTTEQNRHKRLLKKRGWSYRAAAPQLGVNYSHLSRVLNGARQSVSLLNRIEKLPKKQEVAQ